jgi:hypothetical protein
MDTASRARGRIESVLDWAKMRGYRTGETIGAAVVAGARAEQPRADAADGLTSNRSFTEGSNMSDETKPAGLWERTKAWADKNRTISGALVGGTAGTIVPGLGTVIGAIVGAGIGFASSKEKKDDRPS